MKIKNYDLNNKYELLEKQLKKLELELQSNKSNNIININNNNLNDLIRPLLPNEKIMSVVFNSLGKQFIRNWSLACKNTNIFVCLEAIFCSASIDTYSFISACIHSCIYILSTWSCCI